MTALRSPFARSFADPAAEDLAAALKVLADPTRLKILALLNANGPMAGVEIVAALPLKQPTVSHHLRVLAEGGLITTTARGTFHVRSLRVGRLSALAALIDPVRAS